MAVAETFEKLSQALIAHAAALTSFAGLYRGGGAKAPQPAAGDAAAAAPARAPRGSKKAEPQAGASQTAPAPNVAEVSAFAVAWIREGATEAAQLAIRNQVIGITNKYGAQRIADLPATALGAVLGELQAAKAGGAGAASSVIDI